MLPAVTEFYTALGANERLLPSTRPSPPCPTLTPERAQAC